MDTQRYQVESFFRAVLSKDAEAVEGFLAAPDGHRLVSSTYGNRKWTALHTAAYQGDKPMIETLLRASPPVDAKDGKGMTSLDVAAGDIREWFKGALDQHIRETKFREEDGNPLADLPLPYIPIPKSPSRSPQKSPSVNGSERNRDKEEDGNPLDDFPVPYEPKTRSSLGGNGSGRKKALLIGINYVRNNDVPALKGCLNDVDLACKTLVTCHGFPSESITVMTDNVTNHALLPTRENMLREISKLFAGAREGDVLFLHYSGHGAQVPDENDDNDTIEVICPLDMERNAQGHFQNYIKDTELHRFFQTVPVGANATVVFDCCHSGVSRHTAEQHAPLVLGDRDLQSQVTPFREAALGFVNRGIDIMPKRKLQAIRDLRGASKEDDELRVQRTTYRSVEASKGKYEFPSFFVACRQDETAADAPIGSCSYGAHSYFFYNTQLEAARQKKKLSVKQLTKVAGSLLKSSGYKQTPQSATLKERYLWEFLYNPEGRNAPVAEADISVDNIQKSATDNLLYKELIPIDGDNMMLSDILVTEARSAVISSQSRDVNYIEEANSFFAHNKMKTLRDVEQNTDKIRAVVDDTLSSEGSEYVKRIVFLASKEGRQRAAEEMKQMVKHLPVKHFVRVNNGLELQQRAILGDIFKIGGNVALKVGSELVGTLFGTRGIISDVKDKAKKLFIKLLKTGGFACYKLGKKLEALAASVQGTGRSLEAGNAKEEAVDYERKLWSQLAETAGPVAVALTDRLVSNPNLSAERQRGILGDVFKIGGHVALNLANQLLDGHRNIEPVIETRDLEAPNGSSSTPRFFPLLLSLAAPFAINAAKTVVGEVVKAVKKRDVDDDDDDEESAEVDRLAHAAHEEDVLSATGRRGVETQMLLSPNERKILATKLQKRGILGDIFKVAGPVALNLATTLTKKVTSRELTQDAQRGLFNDILNVGGPIALNLAQGLLNVVAPRDLDNGEARATVEREHRLLAKAYQLGGHVALHRAHELIASGSDDSEDNQRGILGDLFKIGGPILLKAGTELITTIAHRELNATDRNLSTKTKRLYDKQMIALNNAIEFLEGLLTKMKKVTKKKKRTSDIVVTYLKKGNLSTNNTDLNAEVKAVTDEVLETSNQDWTAAIRIILDKIEELKQRVEELEEKKKGRGIDNILQGTEEDEDIFPRDRSFWSQFKKGISKVGKGVGQAVKVGAPILGQVVKVGGPIALKLAESYIGSRDIETLRQLHKCAGPVAVHHVCHITGDFSHAIEVINEDKDVH